REASRHLAAPSSDATESNEHSSRCGLAGYRRPRVRVRAAPPRIRSDMGTGIRLKVMLVTVLIAAAAFGPVVWPPEYLVPSATLFSNSWRMGLLLLGIFNVVVEAPGTTFVLIATVLLAAVLLFMPPSLGFVLLIWFVWPPAYMGAWALADESRNGSAGEEDDSSRRARVAVASIIAAVAMASFMYRFLVAHNLQQTAALF